MLSLDFLGQEFHDDSGKNRPLPLGSGLKK